MSLDTAAAVSGLRGITAKFDLGYRSVTPFYPEICTVVQSDGADEEYATLGSVPGMREWLGEREFKRLRGAKFTLENRDWEASVEVEKKDVDDDRLSMYGPIAQQMGVEAGFHPDSLTFDTLVAGETEACWDGQSFFDTDHVFGDSGSQSNDLTYNASDHTAVTEAEFRAAYHQARAAMLGFKRDNGQHFFRPTLNPINDLILIVSANLQEVATSALMKSLVSGGETNIILDRPRAIYAIPQLTSTTKFYLLRVGQPMKPLLFQMRQPLRRSGWRGLDDPETKVARMMTDARYAVGYYAWWNAVLTTFN